MHHPLCIGHRGAKGHLAENTLPSFELAISQGSDWIELDVYVHEGELIVIHDDKVDRTTNGTGELSQFSLQQLRALDAGNGASIPLLSEVLTLVDRRCGINIELKGDGTGQPVSTLVNQACSDGWDSEQFLISSFNHQELAQADVGLRRGALFGRLPGDIFGKAAALDAWSVNFSAKNVSKTLVDQAHQKGYKVLVYTVNETRDIQNILGLGVDGIFSDYPDRLRAVIDAL